MAIINLQLESQDQINDLQRHIEQNVSGAIIRPNVHQGYTRMDGHHIEIDYSGNPEQLKQVVHRHFEGLGHGENWQERYKWRSW